MEELGKIFNLSELESIIPHTILYLLVFVILLISRLMFGDKTLSLKQIIHLIIAGGKINTKQLIYSKKETSDIINDVNRNLYILYIHLYIYITAHDKHSTKMSTEDIAMISGVVQDSIISIIKDSDIKNEHIFLIEKALSDYFSSHINDDRIKTICEHIQNNIYTIKRSLFKHISERIDHLYNEYKDCDDLSKFRAINSIIIDSRITEHEINIFNLIEFSRCNVEIKDFIFIKRIIVTVIEDINASG